MPLPRSLTPRLRRRCLASLAVLALHALATATATEPPDREAILAATAPQAWETVPQDRLMYLQLPAGQVVIELAADISPLHVANIRTLLHQHYYDGLAVVRVQDNFVAQWDDPQADDGGDPRRVRPLGAARPLLAPEFTRPVSGRDRWTPLPDGDLFAPQVGFLDNLPAARDPRTGREWLVHCYGMVGVGRDVAVDSGNGSALYAVIGQPPRRLDRHLTVVGRVISGIQWLSALPRGEGPMGFYPQAGQRVPIRFARLGSDLPPARQIVWQQLRTDSPGFGRLLAWQRDHRSAFYPEPAGRLDLCSVDLPVRRLPPAAPPPAPDGSR